MTTVFKYMKGYYVEEELDFFLEYWNNRFKSERKISAGVNTTVKYIMELFSCLSLGLINIFL